MMSFDSRFGDNITHCERAIAYSFSGKFACAEALNTAADAMACYHDGRSIRKLPKNDRLAVYGDATAQRVLCRRWYTDGYPKGEWDLIRKEALCNEYLAGRGFAHGLDACLIKNGGTGVVSDGMMATAVEAILGAVHLDGGDDALVAVMQHLRIVDLLHESVLFVNAPKCLFTRAKSSLCGLEVVAQLNFSQRNQTTLPCGYIWIIIHTAWLSSRKRSVADDYFQARKGWFLIWQRGISGFLREQDHFGSRQLNPQ